MYGHAKKYILSLSKKYNCFFYNRFFYSQWFSGGLQFFNAGIEPVDQNITAAGMFQGEERQAQVYYEAVTAYRHACPQRQPDRILEIAVGLGGGMCVLSRFFPESALFGLDYSATSIKRAGKVAPQSRLVIANALQVPFRSSSFDLIVNVESLNNLPDMECFFNEMSRLLSPQGYLILIDFRLGTFDDVKSRICHSAHQAGMKTEQFQNLTERLMASVQSDVERHNHILKRVPLPLRWMAKEMVVAESSERFKQYRDGKRCYFLTVFSRIPSIQQSSD